jgi:sugar lactone lactonase YvrE
MTTSGTDAGGWIMTTAVGTGEKGFSGDGGPADKAKLDNPFDLGFDSAGNLFFADTQNHRIRRVDAKTNIITTIAGTGEKTFSGDGGPAAKASLWEPYGLTLDRSDNIYIVDRFNFRIRRVNAKTGIISTIAGTGEKAHSGDGGPALSAALLEPNDIAFSPDERFLYIADPSDHRVRAVDMQNGTIDTFAGTGAEKDFGDGGPAAKAGVWGARAVTVGADGTVYIAQKQGSRLRAVNPQGTIRHFAGTGEYGYAGDGGPMEKAVFDKPKELCMDGDGAILVVDTELPVIRRIDLKQNIVTTVAGVGDRKHHYTGDGVVATSTSLARPHGITVGPDGAIYIGDSENHRVRKVIRAT